MNWFRKKPCPKCALMAEQVAWWKERANEAHEREKAAINGYLMLQEKPVIINQKVVTPEEADIARAVQEQMFDDAQALFQDQVKSPSEKLVEL